MREELGIHLVLGEGIRVINNGRVQTQHKIQINQVPTSTYVKIVNFLYFILVYDWNVKQIDVRNFLSQNVVWNYHFFVHNFSLL